MKTVYLKDLNKVEVHNQYNELAVAIEKARSRGRHHLYLNILPYDIHLRLIYENYEIRKIVKKVPHFWFVRKKVKCYRIKFP